MYRVAFIPALVALFVVAFSLADRPAPRTTRLAPLAFDAVRAFGIGDQPARNSLLELARSFPRRRPGSTGDRRLADRVARAFAASGFAQARAVRRRTVRGDSVEGQTDLEQVTAVRQGLSGRSIVVIAHRDALRGPATAELSGTAALLELARLFAGRDLRKTVVLSSVSGGTGGFAGAREAARSAPGPVDGVFVLGDVAGTGSRRPFVVPWSDGADPAPIAMERTVQLALRKELGTDPGGNRAPAQWLRRALPLTLSEQGPIGGQGLPAVLVSAASERRPAPGEPVSRARMELFGRGILRALTATLGSGITGPGATPAFTEAGGVVTMRRLLPDWAVRLLVGALILPALLAALDAFFRVRRRGLPMGRWSLWVLASTAPVIAAWAWARALDLTGAVVALPAPAAGGAVPLRAVGWVALASTLLVAVMVAVWVRPRLARGGALGQVGGGGAAAAAGLGLALLTGVVWVLNPYAASVLLPATHLWLLVGAPESRLRGRLGWAVAALGLVAPALIVLGYVGAWSLGPVEAVWTAFGLVAGGVLGVGALVVACGFVAAAATTAIVLFKRRRASSQAPPERLRTRGPGSYAGPGSLGGTESALRR